MNCQLIKAINYTAKYAHKQICVYTYMSVCLYVCTYLRIPTLSFTTAIRSRSGQQIAMHNTQQMQMLYKWRLGAFTLIALLQTVEWMCVCACECVLVACLQCVANKMLFVRYLIYKHICTFIGIFIEFFSKYRQIYVYVCTYVNIILHITSINVVIVAIILPLLLML